VKHRLLVILAALVFIGGIIFACFSCNNPSGMMSQSIASDWEPSKQAFLAGLLSGLAIGMTSFVLLYEITEIKNKKEDVEKGIKK